MKERTMRQTDAGMVFCFKTSNTRDMILITNTIVHRNMQ